MEKDEAKAVDYYTRAAEQDDADAQAALANCYANGIGVEKDHTQAVYWYTKAAEQGRIDAQEALRQLDKDSN